VGSFNFALLSLLKSTIRELRHLPKADPISEPSFFLSHKSWHDTSLDLSYLNKGK
jgi:hypothetical protein